MSVPRAPRRKRIPRPVQPPVDGSTISDVRVALTLASEHIHGGGQWSPGLRHYCDRWLDYQLDLEPEGT